MEKFISCDWGTSSFRIRLIDASSLAILAERSTEKGIASVYKLWDRHGEGERSRPLFYQAILAEEIEMMEREAGLLLKGTDLILSGMASSSLGMLEMPYKRLPFSTDGSDLLVKTFPATTLFPYELTLISGASTEDDVMRGEETQLVGCEGDLSEEQLFIFPGTHSKHILVKENKAIGLRTYMTGEFFELLSKKSILADSVDPGAPDANKGLLGSGSLQRFGDGVIDGAYGNLLHSAFMVRTHRLLGTMTKEENYFYLSGLLIGTELGELAGSRKPLTIVSNEVLKNYYETAFRKLGLTGIRFQDAAVAAIRGQRKIVS